MYKLKQKMSLSVYMKSQVLLEAHHRHRVLKYFGIYNI